MEHIFGRLQPQEPDALLSIIAQHSADPRADKLDLGIGVYRDGTGATPVFAAVKAAEQLLVENQATKAYLGAEGDQAFTARLAHVALGAPLAHSTCLIGVQTPGGSGALRLAAELLARTGVCRRIWLGIPSWPNHAPILREAGLTLASFSSFDAIHRTIDVSSMIDALDGAAAGDAVLVQACCQNPTGADLSDDDWQALTSVIVRRGLVPLIDMAYQGLAQDLETDAAPMRKLLSAVPEAILAYSCNKNFGLYRERVGALWVKAQSTEQASTVRENLNNLTRSLWSMPPDHGAACVRIILEDANLTTMWRDELNAMTTRIAALRRALAIAHPLLAPIGRQYGLFAMLPVTPLSIEAMRTDNGIYMAASGRINICGLNGRTLDRFIDCLRPYLDDAVRGTSLAD